MPTYQVHWTESADYMAVITAINEKEALELWLNEDHEEPRLLASDVLSDELILVDADTGKEKILPINHEIQMIGRKLDEEAE